MAQSSGGPPSLPVGTEVSAKYRGAFCEAQVKTVQRVVKCKVVMKDCQTSVFVTDDEIKGTVKLGAVVEVKHPDTGHPVEAVISKLMDNSTYTVVFDDGDERTLRRTQLCLKGDKHFIESETLDNLPLSHPEHFGTPVLQNKKSKRKNEPEGSDSGETGEDEDESPRRTTYRGRHQELVGKLMLVELPHRKGAAIPALVTLPDANSLNEVKSRDQILVRSFKDSKFMVVTRKEVKEFSRMVAIKNDDKTLRTAFEKALLYHDTNELPVGWDRGEMLGSDVEDQGSEEEDNEYASEDEPFEEKDRFVAQLYKFMDDRGTPINKGPCIGNKDLNLYKLFKIVQNCGGYNKVTKEMKWHVVYSKMGLPSLHPNPGHQIKTAYKKYLDAYETFYRKLGSTMGTMSRPGRGRQNSSRSILNFRGREKSPRSPKPPVEKAKVPAESTKAKEAENTSVDEDQDSASVASEESDVTANRRTPRRDARSQANSKEDPKEKEKVEEGKKKEEKKEEPVRVKKEDGSAAKAKKEVSPGPRAKKEESAKGKKEEEGPKKDERKSSRKVKGEEEPEKEVKKSGRAVRRDKEEEKKEANEKDPLEKESPKKRITRRKLVGSAELKEPLDKKEVPEKTEVVEKKEVPEKVEQSEKKEAPKKCVRDGKQAERKDIPRTLERRDSRASAIKAAEKKETKAPEKKTKPQLEEKKVQRKEKKKEEETEESEKSEEEGDLDQDKQVAAFCVGSKLKVKYGRGKNQKIYLAKVVDTGKEGPHKTYLVHYAGWNTRYDEWIRADRVAAVIEKSEGNEKPKASPKSLNVVKPVSAQRSSGIKSSIFRTPKLGSAQTRATRSSSSEILTPTKKPGKRLTRRGSALTDSTDSKSTDSHVSSDVEEFTSVETTKGPSKAPEEEEMLLDVEQEEDSSTAQKWEEDNKVPAVEEAKEPPKLKPQPEKEKLPDPIIKTEEEPELLEPKPEEKEEEEPEGDAPVAQLAGAEEPPEELAEVKAERPNVVMAELTQAVCEIRSVVEEVPQPQLPAQDVPKGEQLQLPSGPAPLQAAEEARPLDQSLPQLKKMTSDEKPVKELEKGRGSKSRKRDSSMERKKKVSSEIPTLEPILSSMAEALTVTKSDPSPYDFVEDADSSWQPEITKKWEPVPKVVTAMKDTVVGSEDCEEKEKKKVKKKTKKKLLSGQQAEESIVAASIVPVPEPSCVAVPEASSGALAEANTPTVAETNTAAVWDQLPTSSPSEEKPLKKKGRKKREAADVEVKKENSEQNEISVKSGAETLHRKDFVEEKPPPKKRRTKRVSESDKKDLPKDVPKDLPKAAQLGKKGAPGYSGEEVTTCKSEEVVVESVVHSCDQAEPGPSTDKKEEACVEQEAVPFDNTPPTTPEHQEVEGQAPPYSSSEADPSHSSPSDTKAACASESPSDNELTSTASTDNLDSTVTAQQSAESSGTDQELPLLATAVTKKRKPLEDPATSGPKKRKKVHGTRSRTAKKSPKYSMSESIWESQGTPNHCQPDSPANKFGDLAKSPRPSKFNFNADLGEYLEGEERCNFLISKMKEIRSIYMNLKSEVATIDRRRKRARRKERESSQSLRCDRDNSM